MYVNISGIDTEFYIDLHPYYDLGQLQSEVFQSPSLAVKVKVKFTLEHATKVQRFSRGIVLLFL